MTPRHIRRIDSFQGYVELLDRRKFDVKYEPIPLAIRISYLRADEAARVSSTTFLLMRRPTRELKVGGLMAASKLMGSLGVKLNASGSTQLL